jgi:hypothetical protein
MGSWKEIKLTKFKFMKINIWNVSYKITKVILVLIISFIGLFWFGLIYSDKTGWQDAEHGILEDVISSVLRMPGSSAVSGLGWNELMEKNEWFDLEPISDEEWQKVECNFKGEDEWSKFIFKEYYADKPNLSEAEKRRRYCMSIAMRVVNRAALPKNYKDFLDESSFSGDGWYAPCLRVDFHEYILQHPKILRNILKIAERPCDYTKNLRAANCVSRILSCNSFGKWPYRNERTCVKINIISSAGELRSQIVVPRKDNNDLFNKK